MNKILTRITFLSILSLVDRSYGHDHHTSTNPSGPLDAVIIIHIAVQFLVWCILFPVGLIYGFTRARWHVPLQATGFLLTIGGYILGHKHGGRTFSPSLHGVLASIIIAPIASQILLGLYLKLHINEGTIFRGWVVFGHRIVGLSYLLLGWMQVLLGMLVLGNICPLKDGTSAAAIAQCVEPFFTGTLLMQYGLYSYLLQLILPRWNGQSPETWDALILCLSTIILGAFNHWRFSTIWIGIVWFIGGVVSFLLTRNGRRTILPSVVVMVTGCTELFKPRGNGARAMSPNFGALLVLAGVVRVLEIVFSAKRKVSSSSRSRPQTDMSSWSAAAPISFLSAGLVYLTSSEDLLRFTGIGVVNSPSYLAFMLGLSIALGGFVMFLGHIYHTSGRNSITTSESRDDERAGKFVVEDSDDEESSLRRGGEVYELEGPSRTVDPDDEIQ